MSCIKDRKHSVFQHNKLIYREPKTWKQLSAIFPISIAPSLALWGPFVFLKDILIILDQPDFHAQNKAPLCVVLDWSAFYVFLAYEGWRDTFQSCRRVFVLM